MIIGGGLVGVELFGELTALVDEITPLYRHVSRDEVRFPLLQAGDRIMPEIDTKLADYGARVLGGRRGAEIRVHAPVRAIEPGRVHLPDKTIEAETIVLAAGIFPNPVVAGLSVDKDKHGHIVVEGPSPQEPPGGAVLGDCALVPAPDGKPYPNLAQHALREAKVLAQNVCAVLNGGPPRPFVYDTLGMTGPWEQLSVRRAPQGTRARLLGVVCPSDVLPAPDAGLEPATTHHERLDLCALVPAGHREDQPG